MSPPSRTPMSGASVVHTPSDYDIDGMDMGPGFGQFWALRLSLVCTPTGMPILWSPANPKLDEREVLTAMLDREPDTVADRPRLLVITDKGFASKEFETDLAMRGTELLRPSFKREKRRTGKALLKSVRQPIESVNDTLKAQVGLERLGGRTPAGRHRTRPATTRRALPYAGRSGIRRRASDRHNPSPPCARDSSPSSATSSR
ncbi:transposase [Streptomyces sp. NPDC059982]|uniref:transposase n=3 Tax=unclassified Streptomyces TaxID=2593676 RepID=UPI0036A7E6D9